MSQTSQESQYAAARGSGVQRPTAAYHAPSGGPPEESSAFRGWARFGAVVMVTMGVFWAMLGVIALLDDSYLTREPGELLAFQSLTAWGWAHLLGGVLSLIAGARILWDGNRWARAAGIFVAWLSALVNLSFLDVAPVWAALVIGLDIVVIYALTVHGAELEQSTRSRRATR